MSQQPALRTIAMPADTNPNGDIFGGWLMSQMDLAGANVAICRARGRVVTVALDGLVFHEPVEVGDEVTCFCEITKVGTTSVTVDVQAFKRPREATELILVTEGTFTYVKIGDDRRPSKLPAEGCGQTD